MTSSKTTEALTAEGFTFDTYQYTKQGTNVVVLVTDSRIFVSIRYTGNGYWNLNETAQFPDRPVFREAALTLIRLLQESET